MYLAGMCFQCVDKSSALGNLGMDWFSMGAALLTSQMDKGGGGGAAGPITTTDVSTNVSTQISPQISPVFVQQQSPSNSPVNAGAAMMPTGYMPRTGEIPGLDFEGYLPGFQSAMPNLAPVALIGAGILGLAFILKKRRNK